MKIKIGKKEAVLSFGMICWEQMQSYFIAEAAIEESSSLDQRTKRERSKNSRNLAHLIMAAIVNEEEISGNDQGFEYPEIFKWVVEAGVTEDGYKLLDKVDKAFEQMFVYKEFIKKAEQLKKKAMTP